MEIEENISNDEKINLNLQKAIKEDHYYCKMEVSDVEIHLETVQNTVLDPKIEHSKEEIVKEDNKVVKTDFDFQESVQDEKYQCKMEVFDIKNHPGIVDDTIFNPRQSKLWN